MAPKLIFQHKKIDVFMVTYGEFKAMLDHKSGKMLEGKLPPKAIIFVEEWRKKNTSEFT
jgi:hypothetical protein